MQAIVNHEGKVIIDNGKAINPYKYRYADGKIDEVGLRALGWDEESIGSLGDNSHHYAWEDSEYQVSAANKALYGVVNKDNISTYKTNADMEFCPMFDTSGNVYMLYEIFDYAVQLKSIPKFNTSNVTTAVRAFRYCNNLLSVPLFDFGMMINMESAFLGCTSLRAIPELNTSKVQNFINTFRACVNIITMPELDFSSATTMANSFYECSGLVTMPKMNTSGCTTFQNTFYMCQALRTVKEIDFSSATNLNGVFNSCGELAEIRLKTDTPLNVTLSINSTKLSYDSIISILTAASNTTNSNAKTLTFNRTLTVTQAQKDELDALITTCGSKGWTIAGLTYTV